MWRAIKWQITWNNCREGALQGCLVSVSCQGLPWIHEQNKRHVPNLLLHSSLVSSPHVTPSITPPHVPSLCIYYHICQLLSYHNPPLFLHVFIRWSKWKDWQKSPWMYFWNLHLGFPNMFLLSFFLKNKLYYNI